MADYGDTISALDALASTKGSTVDALRKKAVTKGQTTLEGQLSRLQKYAGLAATHLTAVEGQIKDKLSAEEDSDPKEVHDLMAKAAALRSTLAYFRDVGKDMSSGSEPGGKKVYAEAPVDLKAAEALRKSNPAAAPDPHRGKDSQSDFMKQTMRGNAYNPTPDPTRYLGTAPGYDND